MPGLVLVGDSVFDNAAYVTGPDVRTQVESKIPAGWSVSLLAVDGSYIRNVPTQLQKLPGDAKLVVVSAGGNDVLRQVDMLASPVGSVGEALLLLEGAVAQFRSDYARLLDAVLTSGIQSYLCTIYRPNFPDQEFQRITSTAVGLFNDVIVEEVTHRRLLILDIRAIFTDSRDYADPIEPSVEGGDKLADAIVRLTSNSGSVRGTGSIIV